MNRVLFTPLLYASLSIFFLGVLYKFYTWFSGKIGIWADDYTTSQRAKAALKSFVRFLLSKKILISIKVFVLDILFQKKIFKESMLRWWMHLLIFGGFILLLTVHALDAIFIEPIFKYYYSTINPFFFLRELFGVLVLIGLGIAVYRRHIRKVPRLKTNGKDIYAIVIIAAIMISGFLLLGVKMTAYSEFERMVEDFAFVGDEGEIDTLESLWVQEFGLVSPNIEGPFSDEVIEKGWEFHDSDCMECHTANKWALASYTVAKMLKPVAIPLDEAGGVNIFWHIHMLTCFIGLAYLPFSKMFHIIATPVSLLASAVMKKGKSEKIITVTRQVMELDACTHCGTCSLYCSAMMAYDVKQNDFILPSEKMVYLKKLAIGKPLSRKALEAIQQGVYLCTNCDRCTVVCPSGIQLKELWISVREALVQKGYPEPLILSPLSLVRSLVRRDNPSNNYQKPLEVAQNALAGEFDTLMDSSKTLSLNVSSTAPAIVNKTFSYCFGCQNCTTVCPVVGNYSQPQDALGLLPHQIMCALGLGQAEMASGSRMIWDCVTCYQCQEHCPQKVKVADLLFGLKNMAVKDLQNKTNK